MNQPRIYHDLMKQDDEGRLKLILRGTLDDLAKHGITLQEGMVLTFWCDDANDQGEYDEIRMEGTVHYNQEAGCWVAEPDWNSFRHASDEASASGK